MPTNLDDFNRVSTSSQLTHQHLLYSINELFPGQDSNINDLKCQIAPNIDSIGNGLELFEKSTRTQFSLVLCNGILQNQVNPQTNQPYREVTGGSHWTTLHFRKENSNKINAFYADSLNPNPTSVPQEIIKKLNDLKIETANIHKMNCHKQGINECGYYSVYNAKAMDQMSVDDLKKGSVIDKMSAQGSNLGPQTLTRSLREVLIRQFNNANSDATTNSHNGTTTPDEDLHKAIELSREEQLRDAAIEAQKNAFNNYKTKNLSKDFLPSPNQYSSDKLQELEQIAIDMAIKNSLEISSKISNPSLLKLNCNNTKTSDKTRGG
ncbi:hypothetical protein LBMAG18_13020 [Alphaproteobacteria bacterium]|nr:hypothetical protein LBMAG18_13020 [Alphaproteobacteria bacterium]